MKKINKANLENGGVIIKSDGGSKKKPKVCLFKKLFQVQMASAG